MLSFPKEVTLPELKDSLPDALDKLRGNVLTTIPIEPPVSPGKILAEDEWGNIGKLAYPAAAAIMQMKNPLASALTDVQKGYLRPYFGSLVDRVSIHYDADLLTELGYGQSTPKVKIGKTEGMTFGLNIYISDPYANLFSQLNIIAHELIHSQQYEQRGSSLVAFGEDYFRGYYSGGLKYNNIPMEKEAYSFQDKFINAQALAIVNIASKYSLNGSSADALFIDPKNPAKGYNKEKLDKAEFDPGEIFFNLDGSTK